MVVTSVGSITRIVQANVAKQIRKKVTRKLQKGGNYYGKSFI